MEKNVPSALIKNRHRHKHNHRVFKMPLASDTTNTKQSASCSLNKGNAEDRVAPELLMAAKRGDWRRLDDLMSYEGAPVPQVTIDIDIDKDENDIDIKEAEQYALDSVLHAVVSGGDGEEFLMSSTVICRKAKHLLSRCNIMGDTAFHCAVRAGSIKMIKHLMDLARREDDEDDPTRLQEALREQNKQGETVLHEAVRWADKEMVGVLISADAELACIPRTNGASPLYLAILLGHDDIAEQLYEKNNQLSYSGPGGQNALHAAVVRSERMTRKLLEWNKKLIKQGERSSRRTPLHFAASWGPETSIRAKLLLDADESSAYQPDDEGSFPIHVAAFGGNVGVIQGLLRKCPDCTQLRDTQGRTLVHAAAIKGHWNLVWRIVDFLRRRKDACQVQKFASIMNMRDNEGNTALHLAAKAGTPWTMYPLIWYKEVQLNIQNNEGQTALDVAKSMRPRGVFYGLDPNIRIHRLLSIAGAKPGVQRHGAKVQAPELNVEAEAKKIQDSTTTIGVVSVLIITVSFAAAFQLPGGYSTGGNKPDGTPELANKYSFQAFVMANNLAAFCSTMSTLSLMYAGVSTVDISTRKKAFVLAISFLNSSARSLSAAFAFGTYAVLAPVAYAAAVLTWLFTGLVLLDIAWFTCTIGADILVLLNRQRNRTFMKFACSIVFTPLWVLWPYVVIAGCIAYLKVHGIH